MTSTPSSGGVGVAAELAWPRCSYKLAVPCHGEGRCARGRWGCVRGGCQLCGRGHRPAPVEMRWRWPVRVQRVVMPVTGAESWTVVDARMGSGGAGPRSAVSGAPAVGAAGACGRLGRRLMLSAVARPQAASDGSVTIWASSWRLFAPSSATPRHGDPGVATRIPVRPSVEAAAGSKVTSRAQRLGCGICALLTTNGVGQPRQARPRGRSKPSGAAAVAAARQRATEALQRLHTTGQPITFRTATHVARTAGVSRSWLYRQPDLRADIDRLHRVATAAGCPRSITSTRINRIAATTPRGS